MPRKQKFQYETLLRIRKLQEDARARDLSDARRVLNTAIHQRESLADLQKDTLIEASQAATRHFNAGEVRQYYQFERHLAHLSDEKDLEIVNLADKAEVRRGELEEAMKRRRIVERLKERREKAFLAESRKEEQKFSDETATNHSAMARERSGRGSETP